MRNDTLSRMIAIGLVTFFFSLTLKPAAKELPALVLYLSFDSIKGKEVKDLSGKGNHGEIIGKTQIVGGKFGKAVQMADEIDHVKVDDSDSLIFEQGITYMAWGKIEKWDGGGDQWIDKGAHAFKPTGCGIMVHNNGGFYLMLGDGDGRQNLTFPAKDKVPVGNEWHHIAGTYDGKEMIVYADGKPFGNRKADFKLKCTAEVPLLIGGGVGRPQYVFNGALDEVAVFNRALSVTEIKEAMGGIDKMLAVEATGLTLTWGQIRTQF